MCKMIKDVTQFFKGKKLLITLLDQKHTKYGRTQQGPIGTDTNDIKRNMAEKFYGIRPSGLSNKKGISPNLSWMKAE
jgi:hypothetical protein